MSEAEAAVDEKNILAAPASDDLQGAGRVDTFTIESFLPGVRKKEDEKSALDVWRDYREDGTEAPLIDDEKLVIEHFRNGQKWVLEITIKPPVIDDDYDDYYGSYDYPGKYSEPTGYVLELKAPSLPQGATFEWQPFEETVSYGTTWKEIGERSPVVQSTVRDPLKVGVQVTVTYVNWRSKWDFLSEELMAKWDVAFLVEDKRFYAHRSVLSLVSTYFEKMFAGGFREAREKEVPLQEVDPDVFEAFLHCVYPCGSDPPECHLLQLTYLANKFGVESLTIKCLEAVKCTYEVTGFEKLQAAIKTNAPNLVDHAIESLSAEDIKELVESDLMKGTG